jgi:hypothetical protein
MPIPRLKQAAVESNSHQNRLSQSPINLTPQARNSAVNVANLQLEGLLMAVAAINKLLVDKGLVSVAEIDLALGKVEASLTGEERITEELTPANRDAVCFPIRLLKLANLGESEWIPPFSELAKSVGQTKTRYNDQM